MIGNDVVDLELAARQSDWRRKGFVEKVFTGAEQEFIATFYDQDIAVWLLWSMKEAAYKAHQRQFNLPRQLKWCAQQCSVLKHWEGGASGVVRINRHIYYTTSVITSNYVYTSAEIKKTKGIKNVILKASSSEAKERLFGEISGHFNNNSLEIQLEKNAMGVPFFSINKLFCFDQFSLSAHGRYSAYNLSLINCETPVKQS